MNNSNNSNIKPINDFDIKLTLNLHQHEKNILNNLNKIFNFSVGSRTFNQNIERFLQFYTSIYGLWPKHN